VSKTNKPALTPPPQANEYDGISTNTGNKNKGRALQKVFWESTADVLT